MDFHIAAQPSPLGTYPKDGAQKIGTGFEIPGAGVVDDQGFALRGAEAGGAQHRVIPHTLEVALAEWKVSTGRARLADRLKDSPLAIKRGAGKAIFRNGAVVAGHLRWGA